MAQDKSSGEKSEVTKNSDNSSSQASRGMLYVVLISISLDFYFLSNVHMSNVYVKCQCFVFKRMWFIHYMQHVEMQVSRVTTRAAEVRCPRSLPNHLNSLNLGMCP